jgi:hypothetical protein
VPLVFQSGEAFQFDWSEDWAFIAGKQTKLQAAHTKLSHSKAFIVRACPQYSAPADRRQGATSLADRRTSGSAPEAGARR